jgi:hypothetical protein
MLSNDTQKILDNINQLRASYDAWKKEGDRHQEEIDKSTLAKANCTDRMAQLEVQIDEQYLNLRQSMSGEVSVVPVATPITAEPVEIGREG